MKSTFILLCFLLFLSSVSGIDLSKFNTAYWYDPAAPLTVKSRVVQRSDNHNVFLSLSCNLSDTINMRLLLQTNYFDDTDRLLQAYEIDTLEGMADQILLKLTFKEVSEQLLVLEFELAGTYYYYPINLKRGRLNHPQFYPLQMNGIPLISSFLTSSSLKFNRDYAQDTLYYFQYKADFQPADPPTGIAVCSFEVIDGFCFYQYPGGIIAAKSFLFHTIRYVVLGRINLIYGAKALS